MIVRVQAEPFDAGEELNLFSSNFVCTGATVSFCGTVRSTIQDPILAMEIEHYPGMTEFAIREIVSDAKARWELGDCMVIHRYGKLGPGENIVMVAVRGAHRNEAFNAAQFIMDYLKSRAPFWKREIRGSGAIWVGSREEDEAALSAWTGD